MMQNFILSVLILGLALFLYLLQTDQISQGDFNISIFKSDTYFEVRKNNNDTSLKSSDVYVVIQNKEYKIFNFTGNDFKKLIKAEYPLVEYKVPADAKDAISGKLLGNRYVFYILEKVDTETNDKIYEIYKAEYPTDELSKLKYFLIKTIKESEVNNVIEVKY